MLILKTPAFNVGVFFWAGCDFI